jgi:hypothetical protein
MPGETLRESIEGKTLIPRGLVMAFPSRGERLEPVG